MDLSVTLPVSDRFALTVGGLCRAVAARIAGGALQAAVIVLIWGRLKRIEGKVLALLTRFREGRLRAQGVVQPVRRAELDRRKTAVPSGLPRRFGWLLPMVPYEAANFSSQLRVLLGDPEMVALLEASPQAARVLRPLCRMLGVEPELLGRFRARGSRGGAVTVTAAPDPQISSRSDDGARAGPRGHGSRGSVDPVPQPERRVDTGSLLRAADP